MAAAAEAITRAIEAGDVEDLVARMRQADRDELVAAMGSDVLGSVLLALSVSAETHALELGGELAGLWGVAWSETGGDAWLLTTDTVDRHKALFLDVCRSVLPVVLERWGSISNFIDCRHTRALRWGARLGFRFDPPAPFGAAGLPFQRFTLDADGLRRALAGGA